MIAVTVTWHNAGPHTIWGRLAERLGREPTKEEARDEVLRILRDEPIPESQAKASGTAPTGNPQPGAEGMKTDAGRVTAGRTAAVADRPGGLAGASVSNAGNQGRTYPECVTAGETAPDFTSTPFTRQFKRDCEALAIRIQERNSEEK